MLKCVVHVYNVCAYTGPIHVLWCRMRKWSCPFSPPGSHPHRHNGESGTCSWRKATAYGHSLHRTETRTVSPIGVALAFLSHSAIPLRTCTPLGPEAYPRRIANAFEIDRATACEHQEPRARMIRAEVVHARLITHSIGIRRSTRYSTTINKSHTGGVKWPNLDLLFNLSARGTVFKVRSYDVLSPHRRCRQRTTNMHVVSKRRG